MSQYLFVSSHNFVKCNFFGLYKPSVSLCSLSWINVIFSGLCVLKLIKDSLQIPIHSSCLSTTTNRDRIQYPKKMDWAEDFLLNIQQEGRPLEQYVEEFLSVFHLVN